MSHWLRRLTTPSVVAGILLLAGLTRPDLTVGQALPTDVLKIDRFTTQLTPDWADLGGAVRITNPGNPGLRAWGSHVEITIDSAQEAFVTETQFQDATLSSAELDELTGRCGDIVDNGSGSGRCRCRQEEDDSSSDSIDDLPKGPPEPGTLCANLYVFASDQQLAECCACPITPDGLLTFSVRDDLTNNPLTGVTPEDGVIAILTSIPDEQTGECDPTTPVLPSSVSTTTTTIPAGTTTSTTLATPTTTTEPATTSTTLEGETTSTTLETATTSTTTPTGETTTTTLDTGAAQACRGLNGLTLVDCVVRAVGVDPSCDPTTITPTMERLLARRMNKIQSAVNTADGKGTKALSRAIKGADSTLSNVQRALLKAAKKRKLSASCLALLQTQLTGVRGAMATLQ